VDTATVQTASEHQNVIVRCEVDGEPEPTVMWTVKGKMVEGKLSVSFNSLNPCSLKLI
jgi:hypothetical protein